MERKGLFWLKGNAGEGEVGGKRVVVFCGVFGRGRVLGKKGRSVKFKE